MAFGLYSSNHLNILGHLLKTDIINANGAEVSLEQLLEKRLVLVQTRGMGTWLKRFLADECGICINVEFPFLQHFIDSQLDEHALLKGKKRLTPEEMKWLLFNEFHQNQAKYPELQLYLRSENGPLKEFELASEIATLFDQYQAYLPQEMRTCDTIKTLIPWQARLYQNVFASFQTRNEAHEIFQNAPQLHGNICKTIVIFGVSALTPLQMSFFKSLSTVCDVQLYYLNPSEHYWGNCSTKLSRFESQMASLKVRTLKTPILGNQPKIDNPILSQWGKVGMDFLNHIGHGNFHFTVERGYFLSRDDSSCLRSVQSDIFMNEIGGRSIELDDSIRVHNCHTPRREIEVLHDEILGLIERGKGAIQPKDILVMSPMIEEYQTYIDSVFGFGALQSHYAIADRSFKQSGMISETLLLVLNLISRDFMLSEVLDVFKNRVVRTQFGVDSLQYEQLRDWLEASGIRWGEDAQMHARKTHYAFKAYSFESGLERLIMGLALHESVYETMPYDLAPMAVLEGEQASVLGGFCLFLNHLFDFARKIKKITFLSEFQDEFLKLIDHIFVSDNEAIDERIGIRKEIMNLGAQIKDVPFYLDVVKKTLTQSFSRTRETGHFLSGKITFCSMMPMRAIPMKVVAVLGLNDTVFPRRERELTFNLLTKNSVFRRENYCPTQQQIDRFLFLETLLSAQENLLFFYCGQSPQRNENAPPSIVLSELMDYLNMRFGFCEHRHRLYGYNASYFQGEKSLLRSYNKSAFELCEQLLKNNKQTPCFYQPNGAGRPYEKKVCLDDFIKALSHPILFHLKWCTHVDFSVFQEEVKLMDEEVLDIDFLARSRCARHIVKMSFQQLCSFEQIVHQMTLENQLPVGAQGVEALRKIYDEVLQLPEKFKQVYTAEKKFEFEFKIQDIELFGSFELVAQEEAIFDISYSKMKSKTMIAFWIKHLILCAKGLSQKNYLAEVSKDGVFEYTLLPLPAETAYDYLIELVELYKRAHHELIPFFPKSSFVYATSHKKSQGSQKAVLDSFNGSFGSSIGERESDGAISSCFSETYLTDFTDFEACTEVLLCPLFKLDNNALMIKESLNEC